MLLRIDAQRVVYRLMDLLNPDGFLDGFAGPFIRCFAEYGPFFYSAAEHQYRASIGEMTVHAVVTDIIDDVRLHHLVLYLRAGAPFHDHIAAEFAGDDDQGAIQVAAAIEVFDELGHRCVDEFLHIARPHMAILVGVPPHKGSYSVVTLMNRAPCSISLRAIKHPSPNLPVLYTAYASSGSSRR